MRIDAYNHIAQIYDSNAKVKTSTMSKSSKADKVEISSFGKDLQIAKKAVAESDDIRADKVAELKARIQSGAYDVDLERFADMLLENYGA